MRVTTTTVEVTRDARGWQAEIATLGVALRARGLGTLDRQVRELLGTESVDYVFHTGDPELDRLVRQVRAARSAARTLEARARRLMTVVLTLPASGSCRQIGVLLDLSHQRVYQLMQHLTRANQNV